MTYNEAQDAYIFCDASDKGFGDHLTTGSEDEPLEMFGSWSLDEQVQSSTWREFEAVKRVSTHFSTGLQGRTVRVYPDNKNVAHIIRVGSRKISLHKSVMSVHELCKNNSIKLSIVWILRKYNSHADTLSRKSDCDDWVVQDWLFKYLDNLWGPHNCDLLAHDYNANCQNFNSRFWCPGTAAVDTFTVH